MEKHTDRKIKVLQFEYVGEYKDQRFGQNNNIGIHFTVEKYKVDKEMNHFLLFLAGEGSIFIV